MYRRIFKVFFFLTFGFYGFNSQIIGQATWIINPDKIPSFDTHKQKNFGETLSRANVHVVYDKNLKSEAFELLSPCTQYLTPLVRGKYISLYLITPSLEELHVGLAVQDMLGLQGDALEEFRQMIAATAYAFQVLGYGDYLAFCNFGKTYWLTSGFPVEKRCWEMIPLGKGYVTEKSGGYELALKIWKNNYVLFNQTPYLKDINPFLVTEFINLFQSYMAGNVSCPSFFCQDTLPWKLHITDVEEAKKAGLTRIFTALQNLGAVQEVSTNDAIETLTGEREFNPNPVKTRETCVFCKQDVLKKQEMVSGPKVTVLYNYLPYTKDAHFLLVPFQHQESLHCLEKTQFEEMIHWAQKLSFILGKTKELVWFCQNGPRAGQTVPHTHIHVLHRPDPLSYSLQLLNILSGNKPESVSEKDYQRNREWIHKRLYNSLTAKNNLSK